MEKAKGGVVGLRERLPAPREHALFWGITVAGIGLDLWSKHAIFSWMKTRGIWEYRLIDGCLSIVRRENPGAAFGIAEGWTAVLIVCAVVALAAIIAFFLMAYPRDMMTCAALGLFMAGVVGNFYDRLFNEGLVRDFIDVYRGSHHWPAFNVADSMLCIAVGLLLVRTFLTARPS